MTDREKVLKALEHHKETAMCNGCLYAGDDDTPQGYCPVYDDAITLLREQEAVEPREQEETRTWTVCGNCSQHLISKWLWCPYCGRKVKWE